MAFFAALPLWRPLLLGEAIGPHAQILQMAPWREAKPAGAWDVLQADSVLQFHPWRQMVFDAWRGGELPLWNPYSLCGTPLLANSQSAGFYPPHVLAAFCGFDAVGGIAFLAWLHLFWAGLGAAFLVRKLSASKPGALASGALFAMSPFLLAWTPLASVTTTCSWIPWCLAGVHGVAGGVGKPRLRAAALLALAVGMMLLAGHLQFAAYGLMAVVVFAACLLVGEGVGGRWATAGLVAAALACGAALAAPQLAPVMAYSRFSHRQGAASEAGYQAYVAGAIKPFEAVGLVAPSLTGLPGQAVAGDPNRLAAYWPAYVKRGANFAESALSIGPAALALLLALRRKRFGKGAAGVALVGALSLLLAFGTPLNRVLYFLVPGWSASGSPGRAVVLFVLAACVIAGLGWPSEEDEVDGKRSAVGLAVAAVLSLVAVGGLMGSLQSWLPEGAIDLKRLIALQLMGGALPLVGGCVLAGAAVAALLRRRPFVAGACLLGAQVVGVGLNLVSTSPHAAPTGESDPNLRVAFVNRSWSLLGAGEAVMPPNTAATQGVREVGGYDSLLHRDTVAWLRRLDGGVDPAPEANGNMMFVKPTLDPELLADAGVSQVWSTELLSQLRNPEVAGERLYRYDVPTKGRAYTPAGPAKITRDGFQFQRVTARGPGRLVVKDRNLPGWTATVDGVRVPVGGTLWREVELPAGECQVTFRYVPPGMPFGLACGAFGLVLTLGVLGFSRPKPVG